MSSSVWLYEHVLLFSHDATTARTASFWASPWKRETRTAAATGGRGARALLAGWAVAGRAYSNASRCESVWAGHSAPRAQRLLPS